MHLEMGKNKDAKLWSFVDAIKYSEDASGNKTIPINTSKQTI